MLEVLNTASAGFSRTEDGGRIFLNCWTKSSPLIKEIERSVNFAERKCGDLMQELHFYKEYYEKWAQVDRDPHYTNKKKPKRYCRVTPDLGSSSENEFERADEFTCKKIKSKIRERSNETVLASGRTCPKSPSSLGTADGSSFAIGNKMCKSEPRMITCSAAEGDAGSIKVAGKESSKSVPARRKASKQPKRDSGPSSKRWPNLQRFKIRSKSLPQGVRRKFGFGGFFEVFEPHAIKSRSRSRTSLSSKSKTGVADFRKPTPQSPRRGASKSNSEAREFLNPKAKFDSEVKKSNDAQNASGDFEKDASVCGAIVASDGAPDESKKVLDSNNLMNLIAKPNALLPFLRHPIPFIPCSSTSKTFNLGLNVQQVLSLLKRKKHSVTLQAIVRNGMRAARSVTEPTVNALFIGHASVGHSRVTSAICPAKEGSEDGLSVVTDDRSKCSVLKRVQRMRSRSADEKISSREDCAIEIDKLERPEDAWAVDQTEVASKEVSNFRPRCTCFPSKHCVDYDKVLRQYTGWRLPPEPRCPPSGTKSKLCIVPSALEESDGIADLVKVHADLLNLTRKCSSLQEQISQNCLNDFEAMAELDAVESELTVREVEFKDLLNFYHQLITLKEKLRSLRTRVGNSRSMARAPVRRPRKDPLRPTPSMALAKVLKKIQGLQDKIKLVHCP